MNLFGGGNGLGLNAQQLFADPTALAQQLAMYYEPPAMPGLENAATQLYTPKSLQGIIATNEQPGFEDIAAGLASAAGAAPAPPAPPNVQLNTPGAVAPKAGAALGQSSAGNILAQLLQAVMGRQVAAPPSFDTVLMGR